MKNIGLGYLAITMQFWVQAVPINLASLSISNFYDQPIAMQWAFLCLNAVSFKLNAMMKFLGLLLCCGGCVLLYLTHPNQTVLKQAVAKKYRWVGWIGFFWHWFFYWRYYQNWWRC